MWTSRFTIAVICAALSTANVRGSQPLGRPRHLLVLYSFSPDSRSPSPFDEITVPALERKLGSKVELDREYLELQRSPKEKHARALARYLQDRYEGHGIDAIAVVAFPALKFFTQHRAEFLPNTPAVFVSVEARRIKELALPPQVTGVVHQDEWRGALAEILRIQPDTKEVVVVGGSTAFDREYLEHQKELFRPYESRVRLRYINELPLLDILGIVSQLPSHSVLVQSAFASDSRGQTLTDEGASELIFKSASVPAYALVGRNLGQGFVGGPMAAFQERYLLASDLLYRIFKGENPSTLPIMTARPEHAFAFDARQLARWHISEARLPPGALISFRQPAPWTQYRAVLIWAATICFLETLLVVALLVQRSRRHRAEQAVLQGRDEIRDLAGRLIVAQEEERGRIARELHDDVSQQVATAGVLVSSILRNAGARLLPRTSVQLHELQTCVRSVSARIHQLSSELHPNNLEILGLTAALEKHVQEFNWRTGIHVDLQHDLSGVTPPRQIALSLYRVTQEGLRNLEKHSGAQNAGVRLYHRDQGFELVIEDDGQGFEPAEVCHSGGLGLTSMKERMRLVNGDLHVDSGPGKGTRIRASAPHEAAVSERTQDEDIGSAAGA